jgi:hypothetical protein
LVRPRGKAVSPFSILIAGLGVGRVWLSFPGLLSGLVTLAAGDRRAKGEARTNGQDTIVSVYVVQGDWWWLFDAMPENNLMVVDANSGSTFVIGAAFHALMDCVAHRENHRAMSDDVIDGTGHMLHYAYPDRLRQRSRPCARASGRITPKHLRSSRDGRSPFESSVL